MTCLRSVRVLSVVGVLVFGLTFALIGADTVFAQTGTMAVTDGWNNTPQRFPGSDTERINAAVQAASQYGGIVRIPPRKPDETAKSD